MAFVCKVYDAGFEILELRVEGVVQASCVYGVQRLAFGGARA